jgi:tetratricopeptide (TPR) repeat protein
MTLNFSMRKLTQRFFIVSFGLLLVYLWVNRDEINPTRTVEEELAELLQKGEQAGYEYTIALPLWQKGLELAKENHYQSYLARFNAKLGEAYNKLGQYDQAWLYLDQALTIYRDNPKVNNDKSPQGEKNVLGNLVNQKVNNNQHPLNNNQNDSGNREDRWFSWLYNPVKRYWNRIYRGDPTANRDINKQPDNNQMIKNQCHVLKELGILYRSLARYEQAVDYFQQAVDNYHQIEELTGKAAIFTEMAVVDYHQRQYDSALEKLATALDIYRKNKDNQGIGEVFTQMGIIYREQQKYPQAVEKLDDAFKITTEPSKKGDILVQKGITYRENKQYDEAISSLERARFFYSNSENKNYIGESDALMQMGLVKYARNQYKAAVEHFTSALDLSNKINNRQGQWDNLVQLARVYRQQGENEIALNQFWQALAVDTADASVFVTTRTAIYDEMIQFLQSTKADNKAVTTPTDYHQGLDVFELKANRLFSGWGSQYQLQLTEPVADLTTAAKELLPSEVFFIYNIMADKTFLWVITGGEHGELLQLTLPITAEKITNQINSLYDKGIQPALLEMGHQETPTEKSLATAALRNSLRYFVDTSYNLYGQLFPRAVRQLLDKIKPQMVYIIPTGPLCYLPFEALVTQKRYDIPRYLIQNYTLAYIPSVTLFSKWRHQLTKQPSQFHDNCTTVSAQQVQELFEKSPLPAGCLAKLTQPIKDKENICNISASLMSLGIPNTVLKLWSSVNDSTLEVEAVKVNDTEVRRSLIEQVRQAKLAVLANKKSSYHHPYFWANSLVYGVEM